MKDHRKQTAMLRYGSALILIVAAISVFYYRYKVDIESVINRDRHDRLAQRTYESMGYKVVRIDSTVFIYFRGSIHCTTSEIPKL